MNESIIGQTLRKMRQRCGLSVSEVHERLKQYQIYMGDNYLYSLETNRRSVNLPTFLALCRIYGCRDILQDFGDLFDENGDLPDYARFSEEEQQIIEYYRELDARGRRSVLSLMETELKELRNAEPTLDEVTEEANPDRISPDEVGSKESPEKI